MLPDDLALEALSPLLCAMLQHGTEGSRNLSVMRNLQRSENLTAREQQVKAKQRWELLTSERACHMCHKRIGGSVLVVYPSGSLAHYLCFKRASEGEGAGSASGVGGVGGGAKAGVVSGGVWASQYL